MIPEAYDFMCEVEERRKEIGMNKLSASKKIFGDRTTYYNVLYGSGNLNAKTMSRIAKGLGMKLVICLVERELQ